MTGPNLPINIADSCVRYSNVLHGLKKPALVELYQHFAQEATRLWRAPG